MEWEWHMTIVYFPCKDMRFVPLISRRWARTQSDVRYALRKKAQIKLTQDITMQGKRHDYGDNTIPSAGEYGKGMDGKWYCVPPNTPDLIGNLSGHEVIEHEDRTITVSPSILIGDRRGKQWHGYLERGVWREV